MEEEEPHSNLTTFLKWASHFGVSDLPPSSSSETPSSCLGHSLCISSFPKAGGRGLAAVRGLRKGELILRVPKLALLTSDSVLGNDAKFAVAFENYQSLSSTQVLTVCLLAEMNKGKSSAWYPYLMQLPRSYDTLASFGSFETKALQVDDAIWVTEKVISKAEFDWKEAIGLLKQLELKSQFLKFKAWLWASATISSRTLHIPWDSAGCLCPVGDFFNYAPPGEELSPTEVSESCFEESLLQVRSFQNGDGTKDPILDNEQSDVYSGRLTDGGYEEDFAAYCFYAKKFYKCGEQVLLSYGTYSNLELLEHYGFLLNENPNDKVFIPLEHDIFVCHSWPADSMYIQHDGKPSFSLLSALRLWATPPNQRKLIGYHALSGSQLSPANDVIVMKWLSSSCCAILNSLPSTIEDDESLLTAIGKAQQLQSFDKPNDLPGVAAAEFCNFMESMALFSKVRKSTDKWKLAVQWRLRYKKTLSNCIFYCSQTVETLSSEKMQKFEVSKIIER